MDLVGTDILGAGRVNGRRRPRHIEVYVDDNLYEDIRRAAFDAHMHISEWARALIVETLSRPHPQPAQQE